VTALIIGIDKPGTSNGNAHVTHGGRVLARDVIGHDGVRVLSRLIAMRYSTNLKARHKLVLGLVVIEKLLKAIVARAIFICFVHNFLGK